MPVAGLRWGRILTQPLRSANFTECRKVLDAVDFPEDRILNVTPRRFLDFLESRGMPPIAELSAL